MKPCWGVKILKFCIMVPKVVALTFLNLKNPEPFQKKTTLLGFVFWAVSFLIFTETASKTFFKLLKKLKKNINGLSFICMDKNNRQIFSMSFFPWTGLSIMGSSCLLIRNLKSWKKLTVL